MYFNLKHITNLILMHFLIRLFWIAYDWSREDQNMGFYADNVEKSLDNVHSLTNENSIQNC